MTRRPMREREATENKTHIAPPGCEGAVADATAGTQHQRRWAVALPRSGRSGETPARRETRPMPGIEPAAATGRGDTRSRTCGLQRNNAAVVRSTCRRRGRVAQSGTASGPDVASRRTMRGRRPAAAKRRRGTRRQCVSAGCVLRSAGNDGWVTAQHAAKPSRSGRSVPQTKRKRGRCPPEGAERPTPSRAQRPSRRWCVVSGRVVSRCCRGV